MDLQQTIASDRLCPVSLNDLEEVPGKTRTDNVKPRLRSAKLNTQEFVPYLSVTDAGAAVKFYTEIFEAPPSLLLNMPDGRVMHCEFRVGNARIFLSEELPEHGGTPSPKSLGSTCVAIHHYVADCDLMVKKMRALGSEVLMEPVDLFWGERFARVRDPFGHEWGIATKLKEMTSSEIQAAAEEMFKEMGSQDE
ncbi:MAG: PhnB protein [Candidatus Krumholzibacteriia bacterium]|jgi:PhnB protein